ncbi:MAG: diaminopimelate epimerase [bacterium]|nr:diaminopimelate epimerase [bacterium]
MKFTKMHGCGNDYVYVNCFEETVENPGELAIQVSDRHFGVGSDGLILIKPSDVADFRMAMYNADGSEGMMCGNGIRCVAKFVYDKGLTDKTQISIETKSGIKYLDLQVEGGKMSSATVDMGEIKVEAPVVVKAVEGHPITLNKLATNPATNAGSDEIELVSVNVGNPHAILFIESTKEAPVESVGKVIEKDSAFPEGVNVEFIELIDRDTINMRVWERGSGETFACGTGACASAVAGISRGYLNDSVTVHLLGGDLLIRYDRETKHVFMTGPATIVFEGEL